MNDLLVFLKQIALSLFHSPKTSDSLKKKLLCSPCFTVFPIFMPTSELLPSLFTPILLYKRAMGAIYSYKRATERFALGKERIVISLLCSQKTSDSNEKPKREFPTLPVYVHNSVRDPTKKRLWTCSFFIIFCLYWYRSVRQLKKRKK